MATEPEPQLTDRTKEPQGVVRKNLKGLLYAGGIVLLIVAMFFTNSKPRKGGARAKEAATPPPVVQDSTENNVAELHNQFADERERLAQQQRQDAALNPATSAQQAATAGLGPTGQPQPGIGPYGAYQGGSGQQGSGGYSSQQTPQLTPEQQQAQQLAQKERERLYASRFESNLAFSASQQQARQQPRAQDGEPEAATPTNLAAPGEQDGSRSNFTKPREAGETAPQQATYKRATEVNIDSATGQPYVIYEGLSLDTVLMNRLDGDAPGPVKVLVSDPVYSHDRQHVLIPEGTVVLGEARKIGSAGFGQQRRMAVVFHRMIMPDGYSVDLDQFHGLDQIGEEGLKDKVNNHYLQIFGTSIALGVISGAAQITQGGTGYNSNGSQSFVNGAAAGISQQSTTVLDRFIQIPPNIVIREGHRVKVYFTQDLLLPAYSNHTIAQSF